MMHFFRRIVLIGSVCFLPGVFIAGFLPLQKINSAVYTIFNETHVTKLLPGAGYKPDLSYLVADIKYRDGEVKIYEFREGRNAPAIAKCFMEIS